jgi:hypothetical protein
MTDLNVKLNLKNFRKKQEKILCDLRFSEEFVCMTPKA